MMAKFIVCLSLNKHRLLLKLLRHDIHILTFFILKLDFFQKKCQAHCLQTNIWDQKARNEMDYWATERLLGGPKENIKILPKHKLEHDQ